MSHFLALKLNKLLIAKWGKQLERHTEVWKFHLVTYKNIGSAVLGNRELEIFRLT